MSEYISDIEEIEDESTALDKDNWSKSRQVISGIMRKHIVRMIAAGESYLPLPREPMIEATLKYVHHGSSKLDNDIKLNSLYKHVRVSYRKEYRRVIKGLSLIEEMVLSIYPKRAQRTKKALIASAQMIWLKRQYKITEKEIKYLSTIQLDVLKVYNKNN